MANRNLIITTLVIGVFSFFIFTISESVFLNPGPNSICFSTAHSRWCYTPNKILLT